MARVKKKHVEEFNPWPPFVDVFSSVILVLLLFLLVTIVNIAYYMQFNSKTTSESTQSSKTNNLNPGIDITDMITMKKVIAPSSQDEGKAPLFGGGTSSGNALVAEKDQDLVSQNIKKLNESEILVEFNSGEIFVDDNARAKVLSFIKEQKKIDKNTKIEISVANSTQIPSTTIAKQISLGRALNIKNLIKKEDYKLSDISLNIKNIKDEKHKNGYVKLKVINSIPK